jgi:hypothetical protein
MLRNTHNMLLKKQCPKCGGRLLINADRYGAYVSCIQCGWSKDLTPGEQLPKVTNLDEAYPATGDGCRVSQSCFICPLDDCKYEAPSTTIVWLQDQRVLKVFAEYQHLGTTAAARATAQAINVTERTVFRALKRNRQVRAA